MRVKNLIKLNGTTVELNEKFCIFKYLEDNLNIDLSSLNVDLNTFPQPSDDDFQNLLYIGGYTLHELKIKVECVHCISAYSIEGLNLPSNHEFTSGVNRGKLSFPSQHLIHILSSCNVLFTNFIQVKLESNIKSMSLKTWLQFSMNFVMKTKYIKVDKYLVISLDKFAKILFNNFSKSLISYYEESKTTMNKGSIRPLQIIES